MQMHKLTLKKRITAALNNKSGVSLIFVLGVMMLLMAIGTSVLTAASANVGANIRQDNYNRALVLSDSVHRNIMHSLLEPDQNDELVFENSLAYKLIRAIHLDKENEIPNTFDLEIDIPGVDMDALESVSIGFILKHKTPIGPFGAIFNDLYNSDGDIIGEYLHTKRTPLTVRIDVVMVVTVMVEVEGSGSAFGNRVIITRATYSYNGGTFSDEGLVNDFEINPIVVGNLEDMKLVIPGEWSLLYYETNQS
jgi:hypothetical protein